MSTCHGMMPWDDMMTCHSMMTCHGMMTCRRMMTCHGMMACHGMMICHDMDPNWIVMFFSRLCLQGSLDWPQMSPMGHKSGPYGGQWGPHAAQVGTHGGHMGPNERTSRPPGVVPHDIPPQGHREDTARTLEGHREDAISLHLGSLVKSN